MSAIIGRSAFRAVRPLHLRAARPRFASGVTAGEGASAEKDAGREALKRGAKRDPELYV
jgi:hypothetical protein